MRSGFTPLGDYLHRWRNWLSGQSISERQLREAVKEFFPAAEDWGMELKNGVLTIKAPAAWRSQVFLNQQRVLDHLRRRLGDKAAPQRINFSHGG